MLTKTRQTTKGSFVSQANRVENTKPETPHKKYLKNAYMQNWARVILGSAAMKRMK